MEKVIVWIKERLFLVALVLIGVVYLSVSGEWRVYTNPFVRAGAWLKAQFVGETENNNGVEDDTTKLPEQVKPEKEVSGGDVSVGDVSANDVSVGDVSASDVSVGDVSVGDVSASDAEKKDSSFKSADKNTVSDNDAEIAITVEPVKEDNKSVEEDKQPVKEPSDRELDKNADEDVSAEDVIIDSETVVKEDAEQADGEVVYQTVSEDYFADALFIGNSRTVGMYEYGDLQDTATFYATNGLTIHKVLTASIVEMEGQKLTVEEALQKKQFGKIYMMLGINEMGTGTVESFAKKYGEVVNRIQELQPEATIYLQGIMKVTAKRSAKGDYIHNEGIEARNVEIAKLADNEQIFYLDMNTVVCDETGGLEPSYTGDGVHLKAQYYDVWKEYLLEHAVDMP